MNKRGRAITRRIAIERIIFMVELLTPSSEEAKVISLKNI